MKLARCVGRVLIIFDNDVKLWKSHDGHVVAPKALLTWLAHLEHGASHSSKGGMCAIVTKTWYAPGFTLVAECVHSIAKFARFVKNIIRQKGHAMFLLHTQLQWDRLYMSKLILLKCKHVVDINMS